MKKILIALIFSFSLVAGKAESAVDSGIFADVDKEIEEQKQIEKEASSHKESASIFSGFSSSLFFTFSPNLMINTDDATKSAPSPVMYSLGIGGDFSFLNGISFQTHASFFTNYYLWDGVDAQPAEVENRTATALSCMIDCCAGYTWKLGPGKTHTLSLQGGAGFFLRYALLSNGVDSTDVNRDTGSLASDDVSDINAWFYKGMNFFYPELQISYSYRFSDVWSAGCEFRAYVPLESIVTSGDIDGMIFSLGLKLSHR